MPRFFIDLHDGTEPVRDAVGCELPHLDAARAQAVRIMTKVAQGFRDGPGRQDYVAAVRDVLGAVRLRLRVSLDADHIEDHHPGASAGSSGIAASPAIWVSNPLKLRCYLVSVGRERRSASVYAVLASADDEALRTVEAAFDRQTKVALVGGLSKDLVRQLCLRPGELRLI